MSKKTKILVVDDEKDIRELLKYNLEKEGYEVMTEGSGEEAIKTSKKFRPEIILLDIMMPEMDGVETCRRLRTINELKESYILFLTARAEEYSEIAGFDAGADDYILKPIKPRALMSRLQAVSRRGKYSSSDKELVKVGKLEINKTSYTVKVGKKEITLPKKEFELLTFLAEHPNKVYSRDDLLQNVWGSEVYVLARTVDVHIRKVREKIGDGFISTVKGVGYKFLEDN